MMHRLKTKESCKIDDDSDGGQFSTCSYTSLSSVGKNFDPEHERYMKYKNSNENANTPPKENRPALPSYVTPRRLSRSSDISPLNPVRRRLFSDDPNTSEGHIGFRQLEDCFFPIESSNPTDTFDSFETSGGESKQDKLGSLRGRMQNYFNILSPEEQQDDLKRLYNYFIRDRKKSCDTPDTMDSFDYENIDDYYDNSKDRFVSLRKKMHDYFSHLSPGDRQADFKRLYDCFRKQSSSSAGSSWTLDSFDYANIDDFYGVKVTPKKESLKEKMRRYFDSISPFYSNALKLLFFQPDLSTPPKTPYYGNSFRRIFSQPQSPDYSRAFKKLFSVDQRYGLPRRRFSSPSHSRSLNRLFSRSQFTPRYGNSFRRIFSQPQSPDYSRAFKKLFSVDQRYGLPRRRFSSPSHSRSLNRLFSGSQFTPRYGNSFRRIFSQPQSPDYSRAFKKLFSVDQRYGLPRRRFSSPSHSRSLNRLFSGSQFTPRYGNSFRRIFSQPQSPDYSRAFKKLFSVDQRYGLPKRSISSPSHSRSLNRLFSGSQFTPRYGNSFRRIFSQPQSPDYSRAFKKLFSVDQRYGLPKRSISSPSHSRSLNRLFSGSQFTPRYGNSFRRIFSQPQSPDYSRAFKKLFSVDQRYGLPRRRFSSPSHSLSPDRLFSRSQFTPNYGSAFKNLFSPLSSKLPQIVITEDNIEKSPGLFSGAFFNRQSDQNNNFLTIPSRFHRNKTISVPVPVVQLSPIRHKYPINVMKLLDDDESESEDEDEIPSLEKDPSMEASLRAGSLLEVSPKKKKKGIVKSLSKMFGKKKKDELQGVTSIFRKKKKEPVIESSSGEISILEAMKTTPVQASSSEESSIFERIKKESILGKPFRPTSIFKKKKKEPIKDTFFEEISMFKKDDPVLEVCSEETSSTSEPKEKNKLKKKISSLFKGIGKKREE